MWKKIAAVFGILVLLTVVLLWANKAYRDAHYFDDYDPAAPLNIAVLETSAINAGTEAAAGLVKFTFDGYKGEKVPTLMTLPENRAASKLPVVIFLHGIGQNKNFMKDITAPFNQAGFSFVSFDQYTQGERKQTGKKSFFAGARAFIQRPAKTVNETRRLIDYLCGNPDIDSRRIYLVGASYGAVTGSTVLAKDKRLRAGVLVYGGGDFSKLFDSYANHLGAAVLLGLIDGKNIDPEKPPLPKLTASQERKVSLFLGGVIPVIRFLCGAADPVRYADQIAPTPVYFQNGKYDVMVPAAAGQALQDAAGEPKKVTWYESDHVGINLEDTERVLSDGLQWLLEQDEPFRTPEEKMNALPSFQIEKM